MQELHDGFEAIALQEARKRSTRDRSVFFSTPMVSEAIADKRYGSSNKKSNHVHNLVRLDLLELVEVGDNILQVRNTDARILGLTF